MEESALAKQCRVKIEGLESVRGRGGFSMPFYAEPPELFTLTNTKLTVGVILPQSTV